MPVLSYPITVYMNGFFNHDAAQNGQKGRGEHLNGGSLNRNEGIYMKITHTGRNTTLQQMIDMVQETVSSFV